MSLLWTALGASVTKAVDWFWSAVGKRVHWPRRRGQRERPQPSRARVYFPTGQLPQVMAGADDPWANVRATGYAKHVAEAARSRGATPADYARQRLQQSGAPRHRP